MHAYRRWPTVLREPLLQFLIIGAVLFAADRYLTLQRDDPREIFIDAERVAWLVDVFQQGQGRPPAREELDNLIVKWSQNEVFYREARALGLDQGDEMMRSRLILKMRNILFNRIVQDPPDEDELREWFELNRADYDVPPRYTFEQFPLDDIAEEAAAKRIAEKLVDEPAPERYQQKLRAYPRRPASNIQALFGAHWRDNLVASPVGQWVPVQSQQGWHLARITERHEPIPAQFEQVKSSVSKNFMEISADMQLVEMAAEIADKYQVHREVDETELALILAAAENAAPEEQTTADSRTLKARAGASKQGQVN